LLLAADKAAMCGYGEWFGALGIAEQMMELPSGTAATPWKS